MTRAGLFASIAVAAAGTFLNGPAAAQTFTTLYSFGFGSGGNRPVGGIAILNNVLYGSTVFGGSTGCGAARGCGTIFSVNAETGHEMVLRMLRAQKGQPNPPSITAAHGGRVYGVTYDGGPSAAGTVFWIDVATGRKRTLYAFKGGSDGQDPNGVTYENGVLYGTTSAGGGSLSGGIVFAIDAITGIEAVLHRFAGGADGAHPSGGLTYKNGTLFGTTYGGGSGCYGFGCGTVFSVDAATATESILYTFSDRKGAPNGGLVSDGGWLYGTTTYGGGDGCFGNGCGTVFKVNVASGAFRILHRFAGVAAADGASPEVGLVLQDGKLFGVTRIGGTSGDTSCDDDGCGVLYSVDPDSGAETIQHVFTFSDGEDPSVLISAAGVLYSATTAGGSADVGTVFSFVPPAQLDGAMRP